MYNNITNYTTSANLVGDDHVTINFKNYSFPLLKYSYYNQRLQNLSGFDGFAPRTLWPDIKIMANNQTSTNVLLVINTTHEVNIGLGPDFPPIILGKDEVILQ